MQWLINTVSSFFGDAMSPDEKRAAVINKITMHGTPGRRIFENVLSLNKRRERHDDDGDDGEEELKRLHAYKGFFVLVTTKEDWLKTSGDFPRPGPMRHAIYRDVDSVDYIGEQIITDGTVFTYARDNLDDYGNKLPGFHAVFTDKEALLVFVHSSHLGDRVSYTKIGNPYLTEPLNKTRDPFVVFDAAALIEEANVNTGLYSYFILTPDSSVLLPAYNKECIRIGKRTVSTD